MAEPVRVLLPDALVRLFPGASRQLHVIAGSVGEAIVELDRRWPGMADRLCDSTPAIRRHINIFVDGDKARLATALRPGAEMFVTTAISGG
ncbi:MoaD/ThiS family protein [Roseomonas sp. HF4]|uniref:MoaD/ThiS family protein n=1 Tax=Roseomonas sp. HF4 TaxID=2562313 RepID=UPI0010C0AFD3|nr:MoaD/ThiS family protein [Roseomonas sp. HF4]